MLAIQPDRNNDSVPNIELRGYAHALSEWLEQAEDYSTFEKAITLELKRLGFSDWSYCRLDIPLSLNNSIGTIKHELKNYDLFYQHLRVSTSVIYRSSIAALLKLAPVESKIVARNTEIFDSYKALGYGDVIGIPIFENDQPSHAVMVLAIKTEDITLIKSTYSGCREKLAYIISAIETIGYRKFKKHFTSQKAAFERICKGRPLKLLEIMAANDFSIEKAAARLAMSRTAADKQLYRIRDYLGVKTNHGALYQAIKLGLIHPYDDQLEQTTSDNE